jgi:hypothetical protein
MSAHDPRADEATTAPGSDLREKTFFITHIGRVTVNNYGAVAFEPNAINKVIVHVDTIYEIARELRAAMAEFRRFSHVR